MTKGPQVGQGPVAEPLDGWSGCEAADNTVALLAHMRGRKANRFCDREVFARLSVVLIQMRVRPKLEDEIGSVD